MPEAPRLSVAEAFWLLWRRSFQVRSGFLLVKSGMTKILTPMDGVWRVVDEIVSMVSPGIPKFGCCFRWLMLIAASSTVLMQIS